MPSNPLKHRFGPSVLAVFKSATTITDLVEDCLKVHPVWVRRFAAVYAIAFSAAASIASLVILAPQWRHALKVFLHLERICRLFEGVEPMQVSKLLCKSSPAL